MVVVRSIRGVRGAQQRSLCEVGTESIGRPDEVGRWCACVHVCVFVSGVCGLLCILTCGEQSILIGNGRWKEGDGGGGGIVPGTRGTEPTEPERE